MTAARKASTTKKQWYRTDEHENAVDYLEMAVLFHRGNIPHKWKWFAIALHSSLYAFATVNIAGTNPDIIKKGKHLICLPEAIKRCQNADYMARTTYSKTLELSATENWAIKRLGQEFRNNFEHFSPTSWSIEIAAFHEITGPVCRVIRFLALESGNAGLSQAQINRAKRAIEYLSR